MITAAAIMQPLPVGPIGGAPTPGTAAPLPVIPSPASMRPMIVRPLPVTRPEGRDLTTALRETAYTRMIERLGLDDSLALVDPTA
jgi:hypothetical protein